MGNIDIIVYMARQEMTLLFLPVPMMLLMQEQETITSQLVAPLILGNIHQEMVMIFITFKKVLVATLPSPQEMVLMNSS